MARSILPLIAQGEGLHVDFKFEMSDACKIARSFSAFANTEGGKLLVGVKDNGKIAGCRADEEEFMADLAATQYCMPPVPYTMRRWIYGNNTVLDIDIPEGNCKPYCVKQPDERPVAYIRIADKNIRACGVQVIAWEHKRRASGVLINNIEQQSQLVSHLRGFNRFPLSHISKLLMISIKEARYMVANMVAMDILDITYADAKVLFGLKYHPKKK